MELKKYNGIISLSPIIVFILFYLGSSLAVGDFYKIPISISFIIASIWGVIVTRGINYNKRIEIFTDGASNHNIIYMIWIFILSGAFATLAKSIGAVDATVNITLHHIPREFIPAGIFIVACFISLSIGSSVGTVVALTPFAVSLSESTGESLPFLVAIVLGGAYFGDNLSFISDTTIVATRSQGCKMSDKFKVNIWIALPAAILVTAIYLVIGNTAKYQISTQPDNIYLALPYLLVIIGALASIDVLIVLIIGIISSTIIATINGFEISNICTFIGNGIVGMGELIIITLLAAGMLALVKYNGGITYLIDKLTKLIRGKKTAYTSIGILAGLVNLCTANNTVAIITVGSLAKDISTKYGLDPRKVASVLDSCTCIVQSLIPYGAQALLAASIAQISPIAPIKYLYYPFILTAMVILSITLNYPKLTKK
ncbi:MAG: Na+/H+ antiporter NhaC family protein [Bacteroidales bacterium]